MMFNVGLLARRKAAHPVGEIILDQYYGNWVCPAGVTRVSVVLVGKGGDGRDNSYSTAIGGGGGALTYKNDIQVVPGQSYAWSTDSFSTSIFGLVAYAGVNGYGNGGGGTGDGGIASTNTGGVVSYSGGKGQSGNQSFGGSAARYDSQGAPGSSTGSEGISLTANVNGNYGRGGRSGNGYGPGTPGAIRIIWGDDRSFPNNAV